MNPYFVWFWTAMIVASIGWYALMLFVVGFKGGGDIVRMVRALSRHSAREQTVPQDRAKVPAGTEAGQ